MIKICLNQYLEADFYGKTALTLCMLGNFPCFCCRLLTVFIITFFRSYFRNTIRVSNSLDPDQDGHSVLPDLGPN